MIHVLKTWSEQFEAVLDGSKTFEVRKNDRNFQVGDLLLLREYFPETDSHSCRDVWKRVTYIMPLSRSLCNGCGEGIDRYVVMGISEVPRNEVIRLRLSGGEVLNFSFPEAKAYLDNGSAELVWDEPNHGSSVAGL